MKYSLLAFFLWLSACFAKLAEDIDIETDVGVAAEMTGGASHACFRGLTLGQAYQYHFGTDLWFRKRQLDGDVVAREHERSMRVDIEANLVPVAEQDDGDALHVRLDIETVRIRDLEGWQAYD